MSTHNTLDQLNEINHETLIIAVSHDIEPVSVVKVLYERIPNSRFKIYRKCGTFFLLSNAPEFNQIIIEFLK